METWKRKTCDCQIPFTRKYNANAKWVNDLTSLMSVPLETEVQERIFYDRRITTVVDKDRDANHEALFRLKEHMDRENEMLRSAGDLHIVEL